MSVVIATFDRPESLRQALLSVTSQEGLGPSALEVVVIDNGSPPSTRAAVDEVAAGSAVRVRCIREEQAGCGPALNRGVREACGTWIAFCDDDQVAEPRWLERLLSAARSSGADCVGGDIYLQAPAAVQLPSGPVARRLLGEQRFGSAGRCEGKEIPSSGNLLVRKAILTSIGGFETDLRAGGHDSELVRRIRRGGWSVAVCPDAVMHHVIPAHRTQQPYLEWLSLRTGAQFATIDLKHHGRIGVAWRCIARIGQAVAVHIPLLLGAVVRRDRSRALDRRCLLWRAQGYLRQALGALVPGGAGQTRFLDRLHMRNERQSAGPTVRPDAPQESLS